jgi:hypothetical protein
VVHSNGTKSVREAYVRVAVIDNEINAGMRDIYLAGVSIRIVAEKKTYEIEDS